jgi:hypothetical protein
MLSLKLGLDSSRMFKHKFEYSILSLRSRFTSESSSPWLTGNLANSPVEKRIRF